jgi:hypothetical protein
MPANADFPPPFGHGHLGAIISVYTREARSVDYYRAKLARFRSLLHLAIEVRTS